MNINRFGLLKALISLHRVKIFEKTIERFKQTGPSDDRAASFTLEKYRLCF